MAEFVKLSVADFLAEKLKITKYDTATINFGGGSTSQILTYDQNNVMILFLTNAGGAANVYATPTIGKVFIVVNGSGQTITVMAYGQTGVQVVNGAAVTITCNAAGTDFIAVSS